MRISRLGNTQEKNEPTGENSRLSDGTFVNNGHTAVSTRYSVRSDFPSLLTTCTSSATGRAEDTA